MAVWEAIAKLNTIVGAMAGRRRGWDIVVGDVNMMIDRVEEFVYVLVGERYKLLKKFENISLDSNGKFSNKGEWNAMMKKNIDSLNKHDCYKGCDDILKFRYFIQQIINLGQGIPPDYIDSYAFLASLSQGLQTCREWRKITDDVDVCFWRAEEIFQAMVVLEPNVPYKLFFTIPPLKKQKWAEEQRNNIEILKSKHEFGTAQRGEQWKPVEEFQGILETFIGGRMDSGNPFQEIKTKLTKARDKVPFDY